MVWLVICIACNVVLAVIFKYFDRWNIDNLFAIVINYVTCVVFASLIIGQLAVPVDLFERAWWPFSFMLAVLFIVGFNIMALSFQKSGVALTAIVQKMSLVVPASFAIALYGEPLGWGKGVGIGLTLLAIFLVNWPSKNDDQGIRLMSPIIILPLLTFILSGIIEVILYYVEAEELVLEDGMLFTASSFGQAAVLGAVASIYRIIKIARKPGWKELAGGISLGLPNYLSIYLLVFLLSQGWEGSILFPVNSIGILILTSLVGFIFYGEKADRMKVLGILFGISAIFLLSLT